MKYWKHVLGLLVVNHVCSYLLKRTESIAANSTGELFAWGLRQLFRKKEQNMEKDLKLGSVADLDMKLSGGKASLTLSIPAAATTVTVSTDAGALVDALKKAIEEKYPASSPVDEAIFGVLKAAVSAV